MEVSKTHNGSPVIKFNDYYGKECQVRISTISDTHCLWIGVSGYSKMHLSAEQVKELIPHLEKFIENREL